MSPWPHTLNQQSGPSAAPLKVSPLPVSSFASGALMKSLNYVRSLVAKHIPRRLFQAAGFAGAPPASRQSLPTLSSLLSRSFNSQISPANGESLENKDPSTLSVSNLPNIHEIDVKEDLEYIAQDVLNWRWLDENQSSHMSTER